VLRLLTHDPPCLDLAGRPLPKAKGFAVICGHDNFGSNRRDKKYVSETRVRYPIGVLTTKMSNPEAYNHSAVGGFPPYDPHRAPMASSQESNPNRPCLYHYKLEILRQKFDGAAGGGWSGFRAGGSRMEIVAVSGSLLHIPSPPL